MWMPLSESDVTNVMAAPELALFNTALGPPGVTDRLSTIIGQVTSLVRGKVAAWPENLNKMGPGAQPDAVPPVIGTIPEELYSDAIEIARFKVLTSLPSSANSFITEARTEGYRSAQKHLDDAANGKLVIAPAPSSTETGTAFDRSTIAFGSVTSDERDPVLQADPTVPARFGFWL